MIVFAVRVYMTIVDKQQACDQLQERGLLIRCPAVLIRGANAEDADAVSVMSLSVPACLRNVPCAQDPAIRVDDIMVRGRLRIDVSSVSGVDDDVVYVSGHGF